MQSETSGVVLNLSTKGAPSFDELFCQSNFASVGDPVAAAVAAAGLLLDEGFMADDIANPADAETHFSESGAAIETFERCDAGTMVRATVRRRGDAPLQIGLDTEVTGC